MSRRVTVEKAAEILTTVDNIVILTHQFPDGDTLGSAFALCRALQTFGKKVRVLCHDVIPEKYEYMTAAVPQPEFEPLFVCAVGI